MTIGRREGKLALHQGRAPESTGRHVSAARAGRLPVRAAERRLQDASERSAVSCPRARRRSKRRRALRMAVREWRSRNTRTRGASPGRGRRTDRRGGAPARQRVIAGRTRRAGRRRRRPGQRGRWGRDRRRSSATERPPDRSQLSVPLPPGLQFGHARAAGSAARRHLTCVRSAARIGAGLRIAARRVAAGAAPRAGAAPTTRSARRRGCRVICLGVAVLGTRSRGQAATSRSSGQAGEHRERQERRLHLTSAAPMATGLKLRHRMPPRLLI
jgi:hypothetical protein